MTPALPPSSTDLIVYLGQIEQRLDSIEEETKGLIAQLQHDEEQIAASRDSLKHLTGEAMRELHHVEEELLTAVQKVRSLVVSFQRSVRRPELARVQQRVEALSFERFIGHEEFGELLRREIGDSLPVVIRRS